MKRDWNPGDVAVSTFCGEDSVRVVRYVDGWARLTDTDDYIPDDSMMGTYTVTEARPLVVIDPDSNNDVCRLIRLLFDHGYTYNPDAEDTDLAAALREFANPTPPKPEEPTARWARVLDGRGRVWCRTEWDGGLNKPWQHEGTHVHWQILDAVRVLSEGVTS